MHAGYPCDAEAILLCELDGTNEEVSQHILKVRTILEQSGAFEVRTAKDEAERLTFWQGRKSAFPAVGAAGGGVMRIAGEVLDTDLAATRIGDFDL